RAAVGQPIHQPSRPSRYAAAAFSFQDVEPAAEEGVSSANRLTAEQVARMQIPTVTVFIETQLLHLLGITFDSSTPISLSKSERRGLLLNGPHGPGLFRAQRGLEPAA